MSSKILREGAETSPFQWRAVGGAPAKSGYTRPADSSRAQIPEARLAEIEQETETRVRAAYNQGVAAGEASAQQHIQQKLDPAVAALNNVVKELGGLRKRVRAEAEEDAVKLAVAIARRLLYRELATDPEAILGLVKAAFGKLNARETHRLRVSPQHLAVIQEHRASLQIPPGLEIVADGALTPGSAVFETSRGELDASIDTQLTEIDRGLTDVLKRRK